MAAFRFLFGIVLFPVVGFCCANDTAISRAIFIGDSHSVVGFGPQLVQQVDRSKSLGSVPVLRYSVSGSAADHWDQATNKGLQKLAIDYYCSPDSGALSGRVPNAFPSFPELLNGQKLKGVVIELGTNDLDNRCTSSPSTWMTEINKLLGEVPAGVPCFWVGPTSIESGEIMQRCGIKGIQNFDDTLKATVLASRKCAYIDTREFKAPDVVFHESTLRSSDIPKTKQDCRTGNTLYPNAGDGTHFGGALAEYWADCAAIEINN